MAGPGCRLIAELFGRQPNLILADVGTNQILEAARYLRDPIGRSIAPGQSYVPPAAPIRPDPRLLGDSDAISGTLTSSLTAGLGPVVALRQTLAGLTDLWAQEVATRAADDTAMALAQALLEILQSVEAGPWEPRLVLDDAARPVAASPVRLRCLPESRQQPCSSLGEAVERLASHLIHRRAFATLRTGLRQILRRLEVRLRTRRAKLADESLEFARADLSRRMGEVLVSHQSMVPRGAVEVTLPDHASGSTAMLTIPLDPVLSPAGNAERLFKLARRGRRGAIRVAARFAETESELARVHDWNQRVAEAEMAECLEVVRREMRQAPRLLSPRDRERLDQDSATPLPHHKRPPVGRVAERLRTARPGRSRPGGLEPRRFISSDGLPILVGRNTEGNDYLTVHLARSQDLWLHVQGASGSHVVVRGPNRTGDVPRRTLIQAAQLAAYYSQARNDGKVAVDYTLRKYVRKPRKAKPGLVTISQERTIIVSPDKSLIQKLAAPDS